MRAAATLVPLSVAALFAALPASCARPGSSGGPSATRSTTAMQAQAAGTIRQLEADWAESVAAGDAEKATSSYARDGRLMLPSQPVVVGHQAILETWKQLMADPAFALAFSPTEVTVARAGDLAYELGNYQLTTTSQRGAPETVRGKYLVIWGRQSDGSWKVLIDVPTTTH
jgi:uncharacterized protein (TIGR02246 family)